MFETFDLVVMQINAIACLHLYIVTNQSQPLLRKVAHRRGQESRIWGGTVLVECGTEVGCNMVLAVMNGLVRCSMDVVFCYHLILIFFRRHLDIVFLFI